MDERHAKQAVAEAGRELLHSGLVARTWGNVSCRTGESAYVITPSGLGYEAMTAEDVVAYNMLDKSWTGTRKPSSEKGVHTAAYARFPDAGFVIHTHQCYASALGLAGFERLARSAADDAPLGGVALAKYGLPGTKTLSRHVARAMESGAHCVLMAHHGALIVGRDKDEAFTRAQRLEELCRAACQGFSAEECGDAALLGKLTWLAANAFGHAGYTAAAPVIAASRLGAVPAQLDDMAQMIGARLPLADADETAVLTALKKHNTVLVRGLGAVCRAGTEDDLSALCLLTEKACIAFLHTHACKKRARLSRFDAALMRRIYLTKYEKKIGG